MSDEEFQFFKDQLKTEVKEYLEIDLKPYKRSQIKHLNNFDKNLMDKKKKETNKELTKNFKKKITNTINVKK